MKPDVRTWLAFGLLALLAAAVRLPDLDRRPLHTDEAVNAYITGQLLAGEPFRYDPHDRHGPALFAVSAPLARLAGHSTLADLEAPDLRRTAVLFSALVVLALGLLARPLGTVAPLLAAAGWVAAPISLYYGRYFIHEGGFVCATLVCAAGLLRWTEARRWPLLAGLGAALMLCFKETAILGWGAGGLALLATDPRGLQERLRDRRGLTLAAGGALALIVVAFTWGGTHPSGLARLVDAAIRVTERAGGEGHEKPWFYYLALLARGKSGPLLLLAATLGAVRAWRGGPALRFWVIYGLALLAVQSAIPYKTPWLALNLLLPLLLLAGHALAVRPAVAVAGLLALGITWGLDGRRPVWRDPAGEFNPYAYAHTTEDLLRLPDTLAAWQAQHGRDPVLAVIADDPWPLPWYLRRLPRVGYWRPGQDPGPADLYLTDLAPGDAVNPRLADRIPDYYGVRPGALLVLWIERPAAAPAGTIR